MTKGARLRQLKFINAIDRRRITGTIFCTCTLRSSSGASVQESWELIEDARRKWFKRLGRFLGNRRWFAMWRKEPHETGVAHLHVLLFFLDVPPHLVKEFRPWNDQAWAGSVGDPSIRSTACRTELLRSWNGVASYMAAYLAKDQDLQDVETGKVWDVVHRELVPVDLRSEIVSRGVGKLARRVCRKWHQRKAASWQARVLDSAGVLQWVTLRPWRRGDRVVSVSDQVMHHQAAGVRVRRRRPKLSFTCEVRLWVESEESDGRLVVRPAELGRDDVGAGAYVSTEEKKKGRSNKGHVVERHTSFCGTFFLADEASGRLLAWAASEYLRQVVASDGIPF
jgi:hypothetical protein